ncbi:MAG: hypothetical protein V3U02_04590 [Calditrichia bacterium]
MRRKVVAKKQEGNTYALKFDTPAKRKKLCKDFCDYIAQGKHPFGFWQCGLDTMKRYIEDYPKDFPTDQVEEAVRRGFDVWESLGLQWARGEFKGANPNAFNFLMKNKYPKLYKDKVEVEHSETLKIKLADGDKPAFLKTPNDRSTGKQLHSDTKQHPDEAGDEAEG